MKKRLLVGFLVGVLAINICKDVVLATSEYNEDLSVNDILTESDINDVPEVEKEVEDLFSYSPMQEIRFPTLTESPRVTAFRKNSCLF